MSSPTPQDIRTAIRGRLAAAAAGWLFYDRERYANDLATLKALYADGGGTIQGGFIRRTDTVERFIANGRTAVIHRWYIRVFRSFVDADNSEITFDDTIELMRDAFRTDDGIGGVVATCIVDGVIGLQVADEGSLMFGGVLCHGARCTLATEHFLTGG